jgi:glycerophosphoryl diester phosphodiesterase
LEAVKFLDAGYGFRSEDGEQSFAGQEIRIPTLGEVLRDFPEAFFNIEIKQASPPMEEPVEEVLMKHKATERVLLAAADGEIMARIRRRFGGRLATGISRDEGYRLMQWILGGRREHFTLDGQALQIPDTLSGRHYISKDLIDIVHEMGVEVHIWTVNDPARMQELLKMGADGIMTDYPDRFYISESETNSRLERQNTRNTP